jgi:hypothetical protein
VSLHSRGLPQARRQLLRHLQSPDTPIRAQTGPSNAAGLDLLAAHLRVAEMYWVAPEMAALAVSSGSQLAAASWAVADRPAPCGLMWFADGITTADFQGLQLPLDGVVWGPAEGGQLHLSWLIDRRRVAETVKAKGGDLVMGQVPPLIPTHGALLPTAEQPLPMATLPPEAPPVATSALAAAWLLMQQPALIDHAQHRPDGPTRRAYARDGLPDPEVTLIDLRRQYVPQGQEPGDQEDPGRKYRHRWVVSGHWRNQPYGPSQSLRRQTWVPSYVKGPEGAPLLSTEKVNVWRR